MQEFRGSEPSSFIREFYKGNTQAELNSKMDRRVEELKKEGMYLERRIPAERNEPCPCGSKKKFKHCCWRKAQ